MCKRLAMLATAVLIASVAHAQNADENTPEGQAAVKPGEAVRFDSTSIADYGGLRRFEVRVAWGDGGQPAPPDHRTRKVRYVADCKANTLAVAAVAVFERSGMLVKTLLTPPGAAEPQAPAPGSQEERWLREACKD